MFLKKYKDWSDKMSMDMNGVERRAKNVVYEKSYRLLFFYKLILNTLYDKKVDINIKSETDRIKPEPGGTQAG